MKKLFPLLLLFLASTAIIYFCFSNKKQHIEISEQEEEGDQKPDGWAFNQRAYPHNHLDVNAYRAGVQQRKQSNLSLSPNNQGSWELVGPLNTGGRVTDVELDPTNKDIIYIGAAVGGIFKTTNSGETWTPIFDEANSLSIGNIAMAPSNSQTLYVGTGEANGSFSSGAFFGDGIYKTTNGGLSWEHKGLEDSQHIGRIVVDPGNENRVFVAATGLLYGKSEDRGVYRSNDGGDTWDKVLYISDSTSVIDIAMNPQVPDVLFAATWERTRYPWGRVYGGRTSGIYRSIDGGDNWTKLSGGLPADDTQTGRIGLSISPSDPNILYVTYTTNAITNEFDALYRSMDSGNSWTKVNDDITNVFSAFGWYFGNVRVAPTNPFEVYVVGFEMMKSLDGGESFSDYTGDMHVDFHALEFHPSDPNRVVVGSDGGVYISDDGGNNWNHMENLPITEFYTCEVDEQVPNRYYGGTQDNGTNRTVNGTFWERIFGGDGFYVNVDPLDSDIIYVEYQFGNLFRSTDGGTYFDWAMSGIDEYDRTNWNTPVVLDRSNPSTIYYGSNRLYKSTNRAEDWNAISPDLTDGEHPTGTQSFGTISTIDVSLTNSDVIYIGTDDGNVQMTTNGGNTWNNVSAGLPDRYVTKVAIDPIEPSTAYVTLSGYKYVDYIPHVLKTIDGGATWEDISGNLPEIPVNDIIIDPEVEGTLYLANDLGVWISFNEGVSWSVLGDNLPLTVVNDIRLHNPTRKLVAATNGRSMHAYDLSQLSTAIKNKVKTINQLTVFPNPVSDQASIEFELSNALDGQIQLLDLQGRVVQQIEKAKYTAGKNTVTWNVSDLPTGNYIVRVQTQEVILTGKMQVLK